jgi:hypothetical protein
MKEEKKKRERRKENNNNDNNNNNNSNDLPTILANRFAEYAKYFPPWLLTARREESVRYQSVERKIKY